MLPLLTSLALAGPDCDCATPAHLEVASSEAARPLSAAFQESFRRYHSRIRYCYDRERVNDHSLGVLSMDIAVRLAPDGTAASAVQTAGPDNTITQCILDRFPAMEALPVEDAELALRVTLDPTRDP